MHPTTWRDRARRRRQRQEVTRLREKDAPRVTDAPPPAPESTLTRQPTERMLVACMYVRLGLCDRVKVDGRWVHGLIPAGALVSHGICRDCLDAHYPAQSAEIHAHEAVAS